MTDPFDKSLEMNVALLLSLYQKNTSGPPKLLLTVSIDLARFNEPNDSNESIYWHHCRLCHSSLVIGRCKSGKVIVLQDRNLRSEVSRQTKAATKARQCLQEEGSSQVIP
jgi:hypothetical protein